VEVVGGGGGEEGGDVGIAPRAEEIVAPAASVVNAVPGKGVGDYCDEGPHVGEAGPEAVVGGDMRGVQLFGAGGPEAFAGVWEAVSPGLWKRRGGGIGIIRVPDVQIPDLRPLGGGNPDDGSGRAFPGAAGADGDREGLEGGARGLLDAGVEGFVDG
jgi:hypothetical protein